MVRKRSQVEYVFVIVVLSRRHSRILLQFHWRCRTAIVVVVVINWYDYIRAVCTSSPCLILICTHYHNKFINKFHTLELFTWNMSNVNRNYSGNNLNSGAFHVGGYILRQERLGRNHHIMWNDARIDLLNRCSGSRKSYFRLMPWYYFDEIVDVSCVYVSFDFDVRHWTLFVPWLEITFGYLMQYTWNTRPKNIYSN